MIMLMLTLIDLRFRKKVTVEAAAVISTTLSELIFDYASALGWTPKLGVTTTKTEIANHKKLVQMSFTREKAIEF